MTASSILSLANTRGWKLFFASTILYPLVMIVGCAGGAPRQQQPATTPQQPSNKGVLLIGDSITHEWDQSYNLQTATFTDNNWTDVGINGQTSAQIAARFESTILTTHPAIIHLICGTNDQWAGWVLSDTTQNIETMANIARQYHVKLILGTVPPWGEGAGSIAIQEDPTYRFARISELNQWITDYGAQQGITVVDYHTWLADTENGEQYGATPALSFDGVHPSPAGYSIMTAKLLEVLAEVNGHE